MLRLSKFIQEHGHGGHKGQFLLPKLSQMQVNGIMLAHQEPFDQAYIISLLLPSIKIRIFLLSSLIFPTENSLLIGKS